METGTADSAEPMFRTNKWRVRVSLTFLLFVSVSGLLLRMMPLTDLPINYQYLLHAHSHIAFLGWCYNVLFIAFTVTFLPEKIQRHKRYRIQFALAQVSCAGMLVSFLLQGYGPFSIFFCAAHVAVSWWFAWSFLSDTRNSRCAGCSSRFARTAVVLMVLASLGVIFLGPAKILFGAGSAVYQNIIYFYLHFQYNGWFTFGVLALLLHPLESMHRKSEAGMPPYLFPLMLCACLFSWLLSTLWCHPPAYFYFIAFLSALVQLAAIGMLFRYVWASRQDLQDISGSTWVSFLLYGALICLGLKSLVQLISAAPFISDMAHHIRSFTIGYLHLVLLGFISFFLISFLLRKRYLLQERLCRYGIVLFVTGFVLNELLLFAQGTAAWALAWSGWSLLFWLAVAAGLMSLGVLLLLLEVIRVPVKDMTKVIFNNQNT